MLALNSLHLIIEHASRYPWVPLIRNSRGMIPFVRYGHIQYPSITFDDRRTIVLLCERLRFVPNEIERERKRNGTKPRTEWSENGSLITVDFDCVQKFRTGTEYG